MLLLYLDSRKKSLTEIIEIKNKKTMLRPSIFQLSLKSTKHLPTQPRLIRNEISNLESSEWSRQSSGHASVVPRDSTWPRGLSLAGCGASHAYILQQPGTSKKRVGMLEGRYISVDQEQKRGKMEPLTGGKKR